jgi:hypothetical protein
MQATAVKTEHNSRVETLRYHHKLGTNHKTAATRDVVKRAVLFLAILGPAELPCTYRPFDAVRSH